MTSKSDGDAPDEALLQFLRDDLSSFEELETLLLIRGDIERHPWSARSVAESLGISSEASLEALQRLQSKGLLATPAQNDETLFAYQPRTDALAKTVDRLAQVYPSRRLEIMKRMNGFAIERIRNEAITTFADAFVLGRRKKDG